MWLLVACPSYHLFILLNGLQLDTDDNLAVQQTMEEGVEESKDDGGLLDEFDMFLKGTSTTTATTKGDVVQSTTNAAEKPRKVRYRR